MYQIDNGGTCWQLCVQQIRWVESHKVILVDVVIGVVIDVVTDVVTDVVLK